MKVLSFLPTFLFALVVAAVDTDVEQPTELKFETTYTPDDCTVKTQDGDKLKVHYTGKLFTTGKTFDSSLQRAPLPLTLGSGQVIKGWELGLQDMCRGEKRTITIPADLAYGSRGFGSLIPANSALVFNVELIEHDPKGPRKVPEVPLEVQDAASEEHDTKASHEEL